MRPIDADALKHSISFLCVESKDIRLKSIVDTTLQELFPHIIDDEPTIEVQPVKRGKWIVSSDGYYPYCSECGDRPQKITNYCANCGAKMEVFGNE